MAKSMTSAFPGSLRKNKEAAKSEGEKVTAKIDDAFKKLAKKMRDRADKAKLKIDGTQNQKKRAALQRCFDLYTEAASHLDERFSRRED